MRNFFAGSMIAMSAACSATPRSVCTHAQSSITSLTAKQSACYRTPAGPSPRILCGAAVCEDIGPCSSEDQSAVQNWIDCLDGTPTCEPANVAGWQFSVDGCFDKLSQLSNACAFALFNNNCARTASVGTSSGTGSASGGSNGSATGSANGGGVSAGGSTATAGSSSGSASNGVNAVITVGASPTVCEAVQLSAVSSNTVGVGGDGVFAWSILTAPAGSTATIPNNPNTYNMFVGFTPDKLGTYTVKLVVNTGQNKAETTALIEVVAPPSATLYSINGAIAALGASSLTLQISGNNLVCNPVVRWNGIDLATTVTNASTIFGSLQATVPASLLATPGVAQITVHRGAPLADDTSAQSFSVYVPLTTNDVLYETNSQHLYATLPSIDGATGNSVARIDATSGAVTTATFVGSEPTTMRRSGDGQYLYVALSGANAVRRFNVGSETAELQFALGAGASQAAYAAKDLAVVPGSPHALAVLRGNGADPAVVSIYDDGVIRANSVSFANATAHLAFSVASQLDAEISGAGLERLAVDITGVSLIDLTAGLVTLQSTDLVSDTGLLYSASGQILDPTVPSLLATLNVAGTSIVVDDTLKRAFMLTPYYPNTSGTTLVSFSTETYTQLGTQTIPTANNPSHLQHWGSDRFAFRADGQLFIFSSPLAH